MGAALAAARRRRLLADPRRARRRPAARRPAGARVRDRAAGRPRPLRPAAFRLWRAGEPLARSAFGALEPVPAAAAVDPDLLFVPLAAFDRRGHRIGYGAGHYDRALKRLRAAGPIRAVGVAYAVSEIDAAPDEPHDQRLDFILTEREWIDARGRG